MMARPLLGMLAIAATLAHPCAAQTLWTSPHGPGMRGLSPATVAAQPALKWKLLLPQGISHGGVTFSDGGKYLYFKTSGPQEGRVYQVDAATGRALWTSPLLFGTWSSPGVTVDDVAGRLYVAGNDRSLPNEQSFVACLARTNGMPLWKTLVSEIPGVAETSLRGTLLLSPGRDRLYLHDDAGYVAALNASDGKLVWVKEVPRGFGWHLGVQTPGPAWEDKATGKTRFVVCGGTAADAAVCLQDDGLSASIVWKASPATGWRLQHWGHAASSPDGRRLYVNGFGDTGKPLLACLDASDGAVVWTVATPTAAEPSSLPPPCVGADGTVYVAGRIDEARGTGGIVAVSPDGKVRWILDTRDREVNGWPAVTSSGVLYVVDQGWLLAVKDLGAEGSLLWRLPLPGNYVRVAAPVPGPDGTVYVATSHSLDSTSYLCAFAPAGAMKVTRWASGVEPAFPKPPLAPLRNGRNLARQPAPPLPAPTGPPVLMPQLDPASIHSVDFSPDGLYIATANKDKSACLWEVASGLQVRSFEGHQWEVFSVAFSPDGRRLATGSQDGTARLWDVATGNELRRFEGHSDWVRSVAFSPDGRHLATGSDDKTARLWDVATGREIRRFEGHAGSVCSAVFSPDGRHLATGSQDSTARLWDVSSGAEIRRFEGHLDRVVVAFSPDGRHLATGSMDGLARLWDVATGRRLLRLEGHSSAVYSVAFTPGGRYLATGSWDNTARLWDAVTGQEVRRFEGHTREVSSVAFSHDGKQLATSCYDGTARVWDVAKQTNVRSFGGRSHWLSSIAFSSKGQHLALGSFDRTVRLWNLATATEVRHLRGHTDAVVAVAFSPDGRHLATGSYDRTARLWEVSTGKELRRFDGHITTVVSVAFSPDGQYLATGSDENAARLWDTATGEQVRWFDGHSGGVESIAFSPDGRHLATGNRDSTARLWDVATGKELRRFGGHTSWVQCVAFSPDGHHLATSSSDSTARLWDVATGKELRRFEGHSTKVDSVAFSPDGRHLATGSDDNTACLWDVASGQLVRRFEGHANLTDSVAFSPDGRYLFTCGHAGSAGIWDPSTGKEICQMVSFDDGTWAVVDPEGRYDASDADITGMVWVVGNEPISLSQLKERYYEPGLLAKVLDFNKEPLRDVAAFKAVGLPPTVTVTPPAKGSSIVTVKLTARSGGIGRVALSVNGSEFLADARPLKLSPKAPRATISADLTYAATLKPGAVNSITAVAYTDTEPRISSRTASVSWKAPGSAMSGKPRFYGLVAGVSDYAGTSLDLKYAGKDAVDVYTTLKMAADRLFLPENVDIRLLTTAGHAAALKPTKANLEKALVDFRKSRTGDTVFLYLAGHGITLKQGLDTYCYLTQEARSAEGVLVDPAVTKQASVTSNELAEWLKKVPALKRVIVLDTCAAGSAGDVLTEKREVPGDQLRAMALLHGRAGTQVLMGCAADAVSYEATRFGQGLLTYAILDGVRGAALQNDQFVDVGTLFSYVSDAVPKLAGGLGGIQKPEFRSRGQAFAVGRMLPQDKVKVPIGAERPLVLRPIFQEQDTGDRLRLAALVRDRIIEMDWAGARSGTVGPGIAYVDADEMPGALRPRALYTVDGTSVSVHLVIWQDDRKLRTEDIAGTTDKVADIVSSIVEAITGAWQPSGPGPNANTINE